MGGVSSRPFHSNVPSMLALPDTNAMWTNLCCKHISTCFVFRGRGFDPGLLQPSG